MANKNLDQHKKNQEIKLNINYTKICIDSNTYVLILGDFNAKIDNDEKAG